MNPVPVTVTPTRRSLVLSLAFAAAMVAAAAFVARALFVRYLMHDFVFLSRDYHWMTPLGYLFLFGLLAIPVGVVSRFLAPVQAAQAAVWVFATMVLFDFLLPFTEIGLFPAFMLAAGAGTVVSRRAVQVWERLPRLSIVTGSLLVAPVLLGTFIGNDRAPETSGGAPPGAPNVLLIILDTVRADELGVYGYTRPTTPAIDAFAQKSVVFESAIATAPWTLPSHAGIFTGQYAANLNADYKAPLDRRDSTLAEVMARRGYESFGMVGNVGYASWESGLARGFQIFRDLPRSFEQVLKSTHFGRTEFTAQVLKARTLRQVAGAVRRLELQENPLPKLAENTAEEISNEFLRWHAGRDTTRPYLAFLNYFDAHDPYEPIEPFRTRFHNTTDSARREPSPRDLYDAELAYLDEQLGRLFQTLEASGALRNTLVIITADHGEHFGERSMHGHFNSIYAPLLHVPLIVRLDGRVPAGVRVAGEVSLRDLGATILDLTGLTAPFPGRTLSGRWRGDTATTSPAIAGYNVVRGETLTALGDGMLSVVRDGWQYILSGTKEFEELYRYREDPTLLQNRVGSDTGLVLVPQFRGEVRRVLGDERGRPEK